MRQPAKMSLAGRALYNVSRKRVVESKGQQTILCRFLPSILTLTVITQTVAVLCTYERET